MTDRTGSQSLADQSHGGSRLHLDTVAPPMGMTGAQVVLCPLALPLMVYGTADAIAWFAGFVHWSPGGGNWTTGPQIAINLLVNLTRA